MKWVYISPHLDDAAISAGGMLFDLSQAGNKVEIWTCMAGIPINMEFSPLADLFHQSWGFSSGEDAIRGRREEDRKAANRLGAAVRHFDFFDCIYRRDEKGEWPYAYIGAEPQSMDRDLPSNIASELSGQLSSEDIVFLQLSVGSHVDHVLVRKAVELLNRPLKYIIDIPYLFKLGNELPLKTAGMDESIEPISEAGLKAWQESVLEYKSQIHLFGDGMDTPDGVVRSLNSYWEGQHGIRVFIPKQDRP